MTPLLRLLGSRPMMLFGGTMGDTCCMVGLIAAATDKKLKGIDSRTWFSLSLVGYLYFLMSILSRILETIEEK
jgi:hypothetical protein